MSPLSLLHRRASCGYSPRHPRTRLPPDVSPPGAPPLLALLESWIGSEAVRRHTVIDVDPATIGAVGPVRHITGVIAWRSLEPPPVDVDDIAVLANVIFEQSPGQRMIALANAEKAAKGHHRIGNLADILSTMIL